jgi:hypothetical protein
VGTRGLIYPSAFEGFRLPLLEALTTGTLVLSWVSMPEVVGECGYYFCPHSVGSLHTAYRALWSDRASGAVAAVSIRARQRAESFNYNRTYEIILEGLFRPR